MIFRNARFNVERRPHSHDVRNASKADIGRTIAEASENKLASSLSGVGWSKDSTLQVHSHRDFL
jgi:hypothetical protein